jgi:cellulose synthase operon protein C
VKHTIWFLLLLAAAGCAMPPVHPEPPSLASLRKDAAEHPNDPVKARTLVLAEAFDVGGDPSKVEAELKRALELSPRDAVLVYVRALLNDVHGEPASALEGYLKSIELAATSSAPEAQSLIEIASYAVLGQSGMSRGYVDKVRERLQPVLDGAQLSAAARGALGDVLLPLAYRKGDLEQAQKLAAVLSCARTYRVAGPFGPRELLGFDEAPKVDPAKPLLEAYDLGPGRGRRATRSALTRGCSVHLGGGPIADGGVSWAETEVTLQAPGKYLLRLDTPNSVEVYIDGKSVLRVDRRRVLGPRVVLHEVSLPAGAHRVAMAVATRHPNPVLELAITPLVAADANARLHAQPSANARGFEQHHGVALALARGDVLAARQALAQVTSGSQVSPLVLLQRAAIALADPLMPDGVRGDEARRLFAAASARDPKLWAPVAQLATLAAQAGRVNESIAALRKAQTQWPNVTTISLALAEQLRSKGYQAAADREIARLRELVPDACAPLGAELEAKRARQRYGEAIELARKLAACDAESSALYASLVEQREFTAARRELSRLAAFQTDAGRYASLLAELTLAKNTGDEKALWAVIRELRARYPRSYTGAVEEFDTLLASGQVEQAREALQAALAAEPASMSGFHRISRALLGEHVLASYRKDGLAAIKAFEASGKKYDGPQVLVLDYMAARVFDDGSSLELVHTVQKAQSDESVNELGELQVPEGAEVLTMRSIKPDGRVLEADSISGKDTISLPSLARGDYVEFEYLRANAPADGFPGGYLGERFYFKSFEVPFHRSQMVMILPKELAYTVDPRGPAPQLKETVDGNLRVLDFAVDESVPLVEEPNSVSSREFIPSVRVGAHANFPAMVDSLRDALIDRDLYDPYYAMLARKIVGDAKPADLRLRAERLYNWVLANIENNNEVFSQAASMLRAKSGNRARVLHYLLRLASVPSQLALARSFASDATQSTMADGDTYDHLLVRVDLPKQEPIWLFTVERWAPFGFLPSILRSQPALLLAAGAPQTRVSEGLLGPDSRTFKVQVSLRAEGSAKVDVVETLHGGEAVAWRAQLEQIPVAELNRRMEQDYVARMFPTASLVSLEITGREQDKPELQLHYVAEVGSMARPVAGGLALSAVLPSELAGSYARTATRKTTELIANPVRTKVEVAVTLPPGIAAPAALAPVTLSAKLPGNPSFAESVSLGTGAFTLQRSLTLPRTRVSPDEYSTFADFCRRVDAVEDREIVLPTRR